MSLYNVLGNPKSETQFTLTVISFIIISYITAGFNIFVNHSNMRPTLNDANGRCHQYDAQPFSRSTKQNGCKGLNKLNPLSVNIPISQSLETEN